MCEVLERVHKIQLEMALEVKRICQKHNIRYFIIAGTLLGAVRHNGFIPWDDDLDIGMSRKEYEKFVKAALEGLNKEYFLQTWDTDPNFGLPIAKLRKKGTKFIEYNSSRTNIHSGIYIDIFPFDNVPMNAFQKWIHNFVIYVLKRIILIRQCYEVWEKDERVKKHIYKILNVISKPLSLNRAKKILYRQMVKYNSYKTDYVVTFGGSYGYWKETIKRAWIDSLASIKFDGADLSCPKDYNNYLTYFYGDYMTFPPEDKRHNRHKVIEIQFEEESNEKSNYLRNF